MKHQPFMLRNQAGEITMADVETFGQEQCLERSHHSYRMQCRKRQDSDGEVKVDLVIEETEIRTNVKHVTMTESQAAELPHTASSRSLWKSLNSKDRTTTSVHQSDLFANHTKELMERAVKGHSWIHGGASGLGKDGSDESEQDDSVDDLIDMIDRSDPHGWTPSSGSSIQELCAPEEEPRSPLAPTHSTKEPWSPLPHSAKERRSPLMHSAILLSDCFPSDAESEELFMVSDSEDEDQQDANASFRLGISKSPEIPITPNSSIASRSTSQDTPPAVAVGGAKARQWPFIGQSREESDRTGSDASEGLVVVDIDAEQSYAESHRDGVTDDNGDTRELSDDNMSVCSMTSGPSGPPVHGSGGLCGRCLGLSSRMRRLNSSSQRRIKDPSNPYYDQWMLLKPWCPRGILGYRREKGKLFDHLPSIWRRAEGRAEGEPDSQHNSCTRPHVFMQRTMRQCQRVLKKKKAASRKARAKPKRKPSSYPMPPLNRSMAKWQPRGRNTKRSAEKKGKMSVVEEQRREEQMWKKKMLWKRHGDREEEMRSRDDDDCPEQRRREEQRVRHEESRRRDELSSQGTKDSAKRKKSGVVGDQRKRRDKETERSNNELASSDSSTKDSVKKGKRSIISQQRRRDEERRNRRHAEMKRSNDEHGSHHSSPEDSVKKGKRSVILEQRRRGDMERSNDDLASQHSSQPQSLELNAPSLRSTDGLTDTDTVSYSQTNEQPAAEVDLEMASDTEEQAVSVSPAENQPPPTDVPRIAPEDTAGAMQCGQADGPVEVETGQSKYLLVDGHADNKPSLLDARVAEHTRGGACSNPACLKSVRQPLVFLHRCDSIDESLCTAEELEQTRPASQQLSATHRQASTDTCPGTDAAVAKANKYATHQDVRVGKAMGRIKICHNDTVSTTTGPSKMGPSVHSNRPPLTNVSQVLNDCRRARAEDIYSFDGDDAVTDHKRKTHLSHSAPTRAPSTATAMTHVSRLSKGAKGSSKLTQPPCEEEKDPYARRTPTPPKIARAEDIYSFVCDDDVTNHKRKVRLSHSAPTRAPPTTTAISGVSKVSKMAKSKKKLTEPPCLEEKKEEEEEDTYAFRTPTPPDMQSCEPVRKLRPFARTYETGKAQPEDSGLRSMLCALDRSRSTLVREHNT